MNKSRTALGVTALVGAIVTGYQCQNTVPTLNPALAVVADVCIPAVNEEHCPDTLFGGENLQVMWNAIGADGQPTTLRGYVDAGQPYNLGRAFFGTPDAEVWTYCETTELQSEPASLKPGKLEGLALCGVVPAGGAPEPTGVSIRSTDDGVECLFPTGAEIVEFSRGCDDPDDTFNWKGPVEVGPQDTSAEPNSPYSPCSDSRSTTARCRVNAGEWSDPIPLP